MSTLTAEAETTTFYYTVRLKSGGTKTGEVKHQSEERVVAKLLSHPDYAGILRLRAGGVASKGESRARPKTKNLVAFARQFAICMAVGLDDRKALEIIRDSDSIDDHVLSVALKKLTQLRSQGMDLPDAMAEMPYVFPRIMVETLRAGQISENMAAAADQAADDLEEEEDQRATVKKATAYPMVILVVSSIIFVFLMISIVPRFATMYQEMGNGEVELPFLTQVIMTVSEQMVWAVPTVIVAAVLGFIWYRRNSQEEGVRKAIDGIKVRLPIFGPLFRNIALVRFCRTLAALMGSNITEEDALKTTAQAVNNVRMRDAILKAVYNLEHGISSDIVSALKLEPLFPPFLLQFVSIGQKTSKMNESLLPVGRYYKREVDATTNNMSALIEPLFLVVLAGMVAIIALGIYLPYFSIGDLFTGY